MALENASSYPQTVILLPADFSGDQRLQLFDQLGIRLDYDVTEPSGNQLEDSSDVITGVEAVLVAAAPEVNDNLTAPTTHHLLNSSSTPQIFTLNPTLEEEFIRKRRSLRRLAPLVRVKRTFKHEHKKCLICQLLQPKQPIVINVIKPDQCGGGCYHPPPQQGCNYCQQPQPPPVYHPPPPPVYHPPPQQCNICQQPPPPPVCNTCGQQPQHQQQPYHPYGGTYSQASAQSSASSYAWGR